MNTFAEYVFSDNNILPADVSLTKYKQMAHLAYMEEIKEKAEFPVCFYSDDFSKYENLVCSQLKIEANNLKDVSLGCFVLLQQCEHTLENLYDIERKDLYGNEKLIFITTIDFVAIFGVFCNKSGEHYVNLVAVLDVNDAVSAIEIVSAFDSEED